MLLHVALKEISLIVMAQVGQSGGMGGTLLENGSIADMARSLKLWSECGRPSQVASPVKVKGPSSSQDRSPRILRL
jgi:hypothetical protein